MVDPQKISDAIISTDGHCWVVCEQSNGHAILGIMFGGPAPEFVNQIPKFTYDENEHLVKDRYVIRIKITPSAEERIGTHLHLSRLGVVHQPMDRFPTRNRDMEAIDATRTWLRLQTVQSSLQSWFANDTFLKFIAVPK